MHLWKKKRESRELLSEGSLQKYAHSSLSAHREQAIQAILLRVSIIAIFCFSYETLTRQ